MQGTSYRTCVLLIALSLTVLGLGAFAQATSTYTASEAAKHIGETATVTGKVEGVHKSGKDNIFLNMGGKYPNQMFTAYIPSAHAAQFPNAQEYEGRMVEVSGKIALYHGKPEIVVTSPAQITLK
jgi:DNA/RNA endonuclease YhcR with UshA esterase domain